jgi:inorganic pyrophosphatase
MSAVTVFVQNEAGTTTKNRHDESSLEHIGSIELIAPYPFAYGFIPDSSAADGDCLDCYVITEKELRSGDLIEAVPVGVMDLFENGQPDHKVLCVLVGQPQTVSPDQLLVLETFVRRVSKQFPHAGFELGSVLGQTQAMELVRGSKH